MIRPKIPNSTMKPRVAAKTKKKEKKNSTGRK